MSEVMASIRGFTQLDAADIQHVDMAQVLRDVISVVRPGFRPDTELRIELSEGLTLEGDPRRLAQAFSMVLRNAGEALDGPGTVELALRSDESTATLTISDSGRGMSAEQLENLFAVDFTTAARVRARFGLPLCRSILHRHGGELSIASQAGRGTTVTITLPLSASACATPGNPIEATGAIPKQPS